LGALAKCSGGSQLVASGVSSAFPLNQVEQTQAPVMIDDSAVENLLYLLFIGVVQLNRWLWIDQSFRDLTRASGLQK